jgi:hypothetical protein
MSKSGEISIIRPVMIDQGTVKGSLVVPLLAGAAVLAVTLFGLVNLTSRPALRQELLTRSVIGVDSYEIRKPSDLRFVLSLKRIGDPVEVRFAPDGGPAVVRDTIVRHYAQRSFPLALVMLGGVSLLAGFVVLLFRPRDRRSRIFYWLSLSFGAVVIAELQSAAAGSPAGAVLGRPRHPGEPVVCDLSCRRDRAVDRRLPRPGSP